MQTTSRRDLLAGLASLAALAASDPQFPPLVRTVPAGGRLVVNARDAALARVLARGCWSEVQRFGTKREEPGGLCARGEAESFDVLRGSLKLGRVEWNLLGEHNQLNALAALGAAEHVGVAPDVACAALARFENVRRRLELRGEAPGVEGYDHFEHHPTAMRATIRGLRPQLGPRAAPPGPVSPSLNAAPRSAPPACGPADRPGSAAQAECPAG